MTFSPNITSKFLTRTFYKPKENAVASFSPPPDLGLFVQWARQAHIIAKRSDLNFRLAFGFHLSKLQAKKNYQPELSSPPIVKFPYLVLIKMESSEDYKLINLAIQKLIEEKRIKDASGDKLSEDDDYEQLLSRLLSQLESLKGDSTLKQSELGLEEVTSQKVDKAEAKSENGSQIGSGCGEIGVEEIMKELKLVKRQNTITHCLLSVMIVVTLIWQLSEVSFFLKVKTGLTHPFRAFGSMVVGMLPNPGIKIHDKHSSSSTKHLQNHLIDPSLLPVKMPDLPHVEFPHLGSSGKGH
ncbi:hypothetical protein REPUB_Repub04eG0203700 [Reevesia pubescens]